MKHLLQRLQERMTRSRNYFPAEDGSESATKVKIEAPTDCVSGILMQIRKNTSTKIEVGNCI